MTSESAGASADRGGAGGAGHPGDQHTRRIGTVELAGDFTPVERELLAAQFGECRLELLARSQLEPRVALFRWTAVPSDLGRSGPSPLAAAPARATYVLHPPGLAAEPAGAERPARHIELLLTRVDNTRGLQARFPGHFPDVSIAPSWRQRLRRWWFRAIPALIVIGLALWLALALRNLG
ncbi:MAG: hypothetical protein HY332_21295 [Chloroflexi bacterium]|nr:hypothetical protein [Chloroflexota bacterium]